MTQFLNAENIAMINLWRENNMTEIKLLSCPFCGSSNVELDEIWQANLSINCNDCSSYGPIKKGYDDGESARAAWNTRSNDLEKQALIDALSHLLEAKQLKETQGKTSEYEQLKEMAWNAAENVIGKIKGKIT